MLQHASIETTTAMTTKSIDKATNTTKCDALAMIGEYSDSDDDANQTIQMPNSKNNFATTSSQESNVLLWRLLFLILVKILLLVRIRVFYFELILFLVLQIPTNGRGEETVYVNKISPPATASMRNIVSLFGNCTSYLILLFTLLFSLEKAKPDFDNLLRIFFAVFTDQDDYMIFMMNSFLKFYSRYLLSILLPHN